MIHRRTKTSLFILTIFVQLAFTLTGCSSSEEDEYIFKNDPVSSAYYGIVNISDCYEALHVYLSYDNITCASDQIADIQNYLALELSRLKPGRYRIVSPGNVINHNEPEELNASAIYKGNIKYHAKSGTIELKSFNESDKEFQITLDIFFKTNSNSDSNDLYHYKNTAIIKYCKELDSIPGCCKIEDCPYKK